MEVDSEVVHGSFWSGTCIEGATPIRDYRSAVREKPGGLS